MKQTNALQVFIYTAEKSLYEGQTQTVILPGEKGMFEILENHKPILSLLVSGNILVGDQIFPIRRGVVKAMSNRVTVIAEGVSSGHA